MVIHLRSDAFGPEPPTPRPPSQPPLRRPLILAAAVLLLLVLARLLDSGQSVESLRVWIESLGPWGPVAFLFLYAAAVVVAIPGSAMSVLAGALFGSLLGVVVVINAATLGAALSFLIARYFARESIARWLSGKESFRRLDDLAERHGAAIVALTRLVPLFPFNLLNYGLGLTRIGFWTYVCWSWICMLPGTILFVVGADTVTQALSSGSVSWPLAATVAASALLLAMLVHFARRRLQGPENRTSGVPHPSSARNGLH